MRWYIPVGVAAVGLGAFFVARSVRASTPKRVALIGDSLVGGDALRSALKKALPQGSVVEVHSYVGQGTGYILDRLGDVLLDRPSHVVILAGVNDLSSGRGAELVKMNLNEMYGATRYSGATPVAIQLLPWRGNPGGSKHQAETVSINAWIRSTAGVRNVRTASLGYTNGVLKPEYDTGDGLHLSAEGQQALAVLIAKGI
jgi:lysophospholipase L1-like esterase